MWTDIILSLPVISFMLILVAGTLIGYALCNPLSIEQEEIAAELRQLRRQNTELQGELQRHREVQTRVERNTMEQRHDCVKLRATQERLVSQFEMVRVDRPEPHNSERLQRQLDASQRQLAAEKHARIGLEDRLQEAQRQLQESDERNTADKRVVEQRDMLQALYRESRRELDQLKTERDALAAESSVNKEGVDRLRDAVNTAQQTSDRIREQREEVLNDLRQAQAERAKVCNLLRKANQRAEQLSHELTAVKASEQSAHALRRKFDSAQLEIQQLELSRAQLESAYSELRRAHAMLQQELSLRQNVITRLRAERDHAVAALSRQEAIIAGITEPVDVGVSECVVTRGKKAA